MFCCCIVFLVCFVRKNLKLGSKKENFWTNLGEGKNMVLYIYIYKLFNIIKSF